MISTVRLFLAAALLGLSAAACSPPAAESTPVEMTRPALLTPYLTLTPSRTPTPPDPATPTPLPSPTPTPRLHTVRQGETIISIAITYGLSIEVLQAANPEIDPNLLSIGAQLIIPVSETPDSTPAAPAPPPVSIEIGAPNCLPSQEGGAWCFALAYNNQDMTIESLTAVIRIADPESGQVSSQNVSAPLNLLPPASAIPLAVYFPPPSPWPLFASAEILTALPGREIAQLYLPFEIHNESYEISDDGQSAEISGEVVLLEGGGQAAVARIVGIAYNDAGEVIGMRRWEDQMELKEGESSPYVLRVYSAGGKITRIETRAEVTPPD